MQEVILAEVWRRADAAVYTATGEVLRDDPDDPYRTAMREMAGVFAGLERRLIVKRLRDGRAAKAARGGHAVGAPGYGWRADGGVLVAIPAEQAALRRMYSLAAAGASTRQVAEALTAEEYPTKRGGRWSSATVSRILNRAEVRPHPDRRMTGARQSLRQRESGRWQARWYDDAGDRGSKMFDTKTEATKFLNRVSADRQRGDYLDPRDARLTLEEIANDWLLLQKVGRRPKTYACYESLWRVHVQPSLGSRAGGEDNDARRSPMDRGADSRRGQPEHSPQRVPGPACQRRSKVGR